MSVISIKIFLFILTILVWPLRIECVELHLDKERLLCSSVNNTDFQPSVLLDRNSEEWVDLKLLYTSYICLFRDIMNEKESSEKMGNVLQGLKINAIQGYPAAKLVFNILHQCGFTEDFVSLPSRGELTEEEMITIIEGCIYPTSALSYLKHHKIEIKTQSGLADWLCVSQPTISRFLRGKPSPIVVKRVKATLIEHYRILLFSHNKTNESKKEL